MAIYFFNLACGKKSWTLGFSQKSCRPMTLHTSASLINLVFNYKRCILCLHIEQPWLILYFMRSI